MLSPKEIFGLLAFFFVVGVCVLSVLVHLLLFFV